MPTRTIAGPPLVSPASLVEATERLYHSLFAAASGGALVMVAWGMVIAPFNAFHDHHLRSFCLGVAVAVPAAIVWRARRAVFLVVRRQPPWLLVPVVLAIALLWADGGWRSSYYLASYAAIALAAVAAGLRWSFVCGGLLASGYALGLVVNGYSWAELQALKDADSVIANAGGYLLAAFFLAAPVEWLGRYVARINQALSGPAGRQESAPDAEAESPATSLARRRTATLSAREIEVAQLVAAGMTNQQIAGRLHLSDRTVQSHVRRAMEKTTAHNRAELAALAAHEGLVPFPAPDSVDDSAE